MTTNLNRVVVSFGPECIIEHGSELLRCKIRKSAGKVVCGDFVEASDIDANSPLITRIETRENYFPRVDQNGRQRIVAANLNRIIIVVAPFPEPTRDLINRYLVAAHSVQIPAVLCINKVDLVDQDKQESWDALAASYHALGYPVVRASAKDPANIDELTELVATGTSIFVGQSGVGKSSLVNRLLPSLDLQTQSLSDSTGKGRHTTTASRLYRTPEGGGIVDSPGVWEYGIWDMEIAQVESGFVEFAPYAQQCKFANCTHIHEPKCAVEQAANEGEIAMNRLESYRRIVRVMREG